MRPTLVVFLLLIGPLTLGAQTATAVRVSGEAPEIDGRLDDEVWADAPVVSGFLQKSPLEGAAPSNRTEVMFAFDGEFLYVGATNYIAGPDDVSAIVTRRDRSGASDRIIISLDSYRDRRTAYSFSVTAGGVRSEYYHGSDREFDRDYSYNPVWKARTQIYDDRWTAEMKIPFSQLRFNELEEQTWGLNINRYMPLRSEDLYWVVVPQQESGWSSRMGTLTGIREIHPSTRIELLPYVAGRARIADDVDPDDPYTSTVDLDARAGLDATIGLGPNLTINAAINPDFGQVEADPAEVNLSAFETFFSERRPFFVEGSGLFSYNGALHYYSRRIGGSPQGRITSAALYTDEPENSTILGAAKLTGRLPSGLSIGILSAVTEREYGRYIDLATGEEEIEEVEPLSYFGVARLAQEFNDGEAMIGGIGTVVVRDTDPAGVVGPSLPSQAFTGGIDWIIPLFDGVYQFDGNVATSHVVGHEDAILRLQRSSTRYFQRPDADYIELDTTRTSLSGFASSMEFQKVEGAWTWEIAAAVESPEYELNDAGRLSSSDDIDLWGDLGYRQTKPGSFYQSWNVEFDWSVAWNFGWIRTYNSASVNASLSWKNFYYNYFGVGFNDREMSDTKTRGGPLMEDEDMIVNVWTGMGNNQGASLRWNWHFGYGLYERDGFFINSNAGLSADVGQRLELSINPEFYTELTPRQYVATRDGGGEGTFGRRYIFSELDFSQIALQLRANYAITPDLTLELYLEPFVATGAYRNFGELLQAGTGNVGTFDERISLDEESGVYTVVDNGESFTLRNPDFTVRSFRSNFVLRWEWLPGSTFFLVWQQNREGYRPSQRSISPGDWIDAIGDEGEHVIAIKGSWWIDI